MSRTAYRLEQEFLAWIRTLPSCISGRFSEWVNGEGRCEAAHVRRANNSGVGTKPELSAVPLTHDEHYTQHTMGEAQCLIDHMPIYHNWQPDEAKEYFNEKAQEYRERWLERARQLQGK